MEEVEEFEEDPPPDGPGHMAGAMFTSWWVATHPPVVTHRMVPRAAILNGGYTPIGTGGYRRTYYGGRTGYLYGGSSSWSRPSASPSVVRGGFGSTGHAASGGGS